MTCGDPITPEWLIGMSAGAVCRVLDDPTGSAIEGVVEAAYEIAYEQGRYRSAWVLAAVAHDGTTLWRSPDGTAAAEVSPDGAVTDRLREAGTR